MWKQLQRLTNNRTFKYGIPMMVLLVGGSFGLREFTQIRYDAQKRRRTVDPSLQALLKPRNPDSVLEEEYEKIKDADLDNWTNIRGPRPWEEDSREPQKELNTD